MSSALRERFSLGASTAGASSFFALAGFFGGLAVGSAATLTGPGAPTSISSGTGTGDSETGDKTSASGICATVFVFEALALGLSPLDGPTLLLLSSESAMGEIVELLNFARLRVLVADDANSLAGTFACARIGGSPLTSHRQTAAVPDSAITVDRLEALQVALHFPAQIAFDQHFVAGDRLDDVVNLMRCQVLRTQVRIDVCLLQHPLRRTGPDAVDVGERRFDAFIGRYFNSQKSWHKIIPAAACAAGSCR